MDWPRLQVDTTRPIPAKPSLAGRSKRGGLLGQAAVLTASANGVDTSPAVRGHLDSGKPARHTYPPSEPAARRRGS